MTEQRQQDIEEASFEALFLADGTRARAPNLDLADDDVFDLGQDEQTAQIIDTPLEELVEDDDAEAFAEDDPWGEANAGVPAKALRSGVFQALAADTKDRGLREWGLKALMGFNLVALCLVVVVSGLRGDAAHEEQPATPSAAPGFESTAGRVARVARPPRGLPREPSVSEAAHRLIESGRYSAAIVLLTDYVKTQRNLTPVQEQAVWSSLEYCARRIGDTAAVRRYGARAESLRLRFASPHELWREADSLVGESPIAARQRLARMLLVADRFAAHGVEADQEGRVLRALGDSWCSKKKKKNTAVQR